MGARQGRVLLATTTWLLELGPVTDELRELPCPTHFSARTRPCSAPPTASATTSTAVGDFFFFLFTFLISEIEMHVVWIASIL